MSYAIGRAKPVSLDVNTYGTGKLDDVAIASVISEEFDLRPKAIIQLFDLQKPIYKPTASYGHFGREGFAWEKLDRVEDLKKYIQQ